MLFPKLLQREHGLYRCLSNLPTSVPRSDASRALFSAQLPSTTSNFTSFFSHSNKPFPSVHSSERAQRIARVVAPQLHDFSAFERQDTLHRLKLYAQLAKLRLTEAQVLTAMAGVALSPLPTTIPILLSTALGTALCSASANTLNQLQEAPFDAQMARTRMRPLVRRLATPMHATGFAVITGIAGPAILLAMVNSTTAMLGIGNIALYAGLYTWLKRRSVTNTWVGAVVGAVPPLMGWTACGGKLLPSSSYPIEIFLPSFLSAVPSMVVDLSLIDNPLSPLAFFMLLFSWQFPHFNSLSYLVRGSYAQAGYRMLSVLTPSRNSLVAVQHAIALIPICSILIPLSGLTTWAFALTTLIPNAIFTWAACRFWRNGGEREANVLFRHSLWYLPVILGLMMMHKQGVDWMRWLTGHEKKDQGVPMASSQVNTFK